MRLFLAYRDLGVSGASAGGFGTHVIRAVPSEHPRAQSHTHALDFQMVYALRGWVELACADIGRVRMRNSRPARLPRPPRKG